MKKAIVIILSTFLVAILLFYYYVLWSPYGQRTQRNAKNVEKVVIGMSKNKMLEVMGEPDTIFASYYNDGLVIYEYEPPFASSEGIDIYLDSLGMVRRAVFE